MPEASLKFITLLTHIRLFELYFHFVEFPTIFQKHPAQNCIKAQQRRVKSALFENHDG